MVSSSRVSQRHCGNGGSRMPHHAYRNATKRGARRERRGRMRTARRHGASARGETPHAAGRDDTSGGRGCRRHLESQNVTFFSVRAKRPRGFECVGFASEDTRAGLVRTRLGGSFLRTRSSRFERGKSAVRFEALRSPRATFETREKKARGQNVRDRTCRVSISSLPRTKLTVNIDGGDN